MADNDKALARLAMLETMIAKGSTDPFHHYARAMEFRSLGRNEDALEAFAGVAERFADYVPTYLMAGQVCELLDEDEQAQQWYERGIVKAEATGNDHALGELKAALADL